MNTVLARTLAQTRLTRDTLGLTATTDGYRRLVQIGEDWSRLEDEPWGACAYIHSSSQRVPGWLVTC